MSETVQHKKQSSVRRVLFVDDDKRFLETIRELMSVLSEGTWEVVIADSPSRAFALMQEQVMELVVVDVQMGVMDGIQMLSMLNRGHPNVQKVVLVFETVSEQELAAPGTSRVPPAPPSAARY